MPGKDPQNSLEQAAQEAPKQKSAPPGKGGFARIVDATRNSLRGLFDGFMTEAAIKQEVVLAAVAFPLSFLIASNVWIWLALVASLLFVLSVEFMNTALERLCDHVQPQRHDAIRVTKDLASTAVFFALLLAGLVWIAAILERFGILA